MYIARVPPQRKVLYLLGTFCTFFLRVIELN
uniref:Uncharacterized protein n=1 Tax=Anguilla anguilla TaxID=7936 RepID=A0A0E9TYS7_ANGAN